MRRASRWASTILVLTACREPDPAPRAEPNPGPPSERSGATPDPQPPSGAAEAVDAVVDLHGAAIDPLSARDDVAATVLLFVSTHCPISNRYAPTIRRLASGWAERRVATWLVYPDPDDDADAIAAHQSEFSLSLPTVRDPTHRLVARAGARVTPEAAIFVPGTPTPVYAGRIDDRVVTFGTVRAEASSEELYDAVRAVLAGDRPSRAKAPAIGCYISDLR